MLLRGQVGDYHETQRRELHHVHFGDQMEATVKHTCYSYVVDKSETQWKHLKTDKDNAAPWTGWRLP